MHRNQEGFQCNKLQQEAQLVKLEGNSSHEQEGEREEEGLEAEGE
jgi:hypothetical protein